MKQMSAAVKADYGTEFVDNRRENEERTAYAREFRKTILVLVIMIAAITFSTCTQAQAAGKHGHGVTVAVINLSCPGSVMRWARRCGMKPVWLRSVPKNPDKYDGLVIPGGGDVNPKIYHAKRDSHTYDTNFTKDKMQIRAIRLFAKHNKPVLGICRGCQVINVAYGGTLLQHIAGCHKNSRTIRTLPGSFSGIAVGEKAKVCHSHHQCVKKLGRGLAATSWDVRDGRIESVESPLLPVVGVQWHPESSGSKGLSLERKFKALCRGSR